jgi:hypothetical protein
MRSIRPQATSAVVEDRVDCLDAAGLDLAASRQNVVRNAGQASRIWCSLRTGELALRSTSTPVSLPVGAFTAASALIVP